MATTVAGQPALAGGDAAPEGKKNKAAAAVAAASEQKQQPAAAKKKLSNVELKKRAKEEKAARRATAKTTQPTTPGPQQGAAASSAAAKAKANKHDGPAAAAAPGHARSAPRSGPLPPAVTLKDARPTVPECFSHLSMARRIAMTHADKDVNPAVLALGQHMSAFAISDSITRLEATLLALKKVGRPHARRQKTTH